MIQIKGCGTALVTPFIKGEVDYAAYTKLVDRQVQAGVDFLVPLATTGETPTLSAEEKLKLLDITRDRSCGKPLLVGCGSNSVPGTLANMELLKGHGADAWLVVVPFYNKPTQEGQYQYFKAVAQASELPIFIYNVPGRTGVNMTAQTCLRLANDVPNIIGIKEASGKIEQAQEIIAGAPDGFKVLSGDDDLTLAMMKIGGAGVISVASNVLPDKVAGMTAAAARGDYETAEKLNDGLASMYKACFAESNPIPAKAALRLMGLCTDEMRLPLVPASEATNSLMKQLLSL